MSMNGLGVEIEYIAAGELGFDPRSQMAKIFADGWYNDLKALSKYSERLALISFLLAVVLYNSSSMWYNIIYEEGDGNGKNISRSASEQALFP